MGPVWRVVIAGSPSDPATRRLVRAAHSVYQPARTVLGQSGPVDAFAASLPLRDGKPTAYLCAGNACKAPTTDPEQLRRLLIES
jgi:hypothetical protein